jgi:hypothetical protein
MAEQYQNGKLYNSNHKINSSITVVLNLIKYMIMFSCNQIAGAKAQGMELNLTKTVTIGFFIYSVHLFLWHITGSNLDKYLCPLLFLRASGIIHMCFLISPNLTISFLPTRACTSYAAIATKVAEPEGRFGAEQ